MFGLIVYAIVVAIGLVVVSVLLTHLIIQAVKTHRFQQEQDSGLIDLSPETAS